MKNTIASILIFGGIIMMAGAAGDCDGKCVEYANSIGDMILYASIGLAMFAIGGALAVIEK